MQHGLVVFEQIAQLARRDPSSLPSQPRTDQPAAERAHRENGGGNPDQRPQAVAHLGRDRRDGDPGRDQRDHPVVPVEHRHHRADRRPERAGVGLGEDVASLGFGDVAQVELADQGGVRVRVANTRRRHDRHEVDVRVFLHLLGERLENRARVGRLDGRQDGRRVGDGRGDRPALLGGPVVRRVHRVDIGERCLGADEHQQHRQLQHQQLAGQAPVGPRL